MTTPDHQIGVGVGVGPGQMGLPGNIRIGSSDNPLLKEPTCAEQLKYSALLPWDLVKTEKNSSVRKKPLAFLLRPLEVLKPVAPQGHLASLHSEEENEFVGKTTKGTVWIGGMKVGSEWTWSDGTPWDFGSVNQFSIGGDCSVTFAGSASGFDCNKQRLYICKKRQISSCVMNRNC